MLATNSTGYLQNIPDCYLIVPGGLNPATSPGSIKTIYFNILPKISESKVANYSGIDVIGRSVPITTYANSGDRVINITMDFYALDDVQLEENIANKNIIRSATHPQTLSSFIPFSPPSICQFKCGNILDNKPTCMVLKSFSWEAPVDVAWSDRWLHPYYFSIKTDWIEVYTYEDLPGQESIFGKRPVPYQIS